MANKTGRKTKMIRRKTKKRRGSAAPRRAARKSRAMTKRELEKFKALLLAEKTRLDKELSILTDGALKKSQKDATGELSGYTYHMADVASDNYERDFSLGLATEEQKRLYAIDEALKRIEDGSYGDCMNCNKRIAKRRLRAIPHTDLCINCQKEKETGQ